MDSSRTARLHTGDIWLWILVVATAVLASEEWGTVGAVVAATAAAAVATVGADVARRPVSLAALCTSGAAVIHFAVAFPHLQEWWGFGVFFLASGWLQLVWSALAPRATDRRLLWAGLAGNLSIVVVWAISRTAGVPLGPNPGEAEAIGAPDAIATGLEAVAVAGCAVALATSAPAVRAARWPLAAAVGATTAYALVAAVDTH